jgi:hypothetical protein
MWEEWRCRRRGRRHRHRCQSGLGRQRGSLRDRRRLLRVEILNSRLDRSSRSDRSLRPRRRRRRGCRLRPRCEVLELSFERRHARLESLDLRVFFPAVTRPPMWIPRLTACREHEHDDDDDPTHLTSLIQIDFRHMHGAGDRQCVACGRRVSLLGGGVARRSSEQAAPNTDLECIAADTSEPYASRHVTAVPCSNAQRER